ncbi:FkbM family methyltransferase [Luteimonas sp. RD2P54]|uniref:FkbM family methyltransferase n=1 Tax=Luteimonas endophytica TaxID=3042023 RepID=A0ABT6J835_9GAMM|nr:FkbM family methyltransferase [Luteimonas endophytica]MDH5822987.1 FkbM family methyltransferase [Luteimonas endophytica]
MTAFERARRVGTTDGCGSYLLVLPDAETDYLQKLIHESGKPYEEEMLQDMAARIAPGDLVLDVGANIGNHAIYLAAIGGARVVAFEPQSGLAEAIVEAATLNLLGRLVDVRACGLGRSRGVARISQDRPDNLGAQALAIGEGDIEVLPLDEIEFDAPVAMIKIDVEGMELDVLEGAANLIARDRPLVYVESQDEASFRRLSRWMLQHGYGYWETFNATPTHLFRPIEACKTDERFERLMSREVIQEYRYHVLLRRARRFQRAAEARVVELERKLSDPQPGSPSKAAVPVADAAALAAVDEKISALTSAFNEAGKTLSSALQEQASREDQRERAGTIAVGRLEQALARVEELASGREAQMRRDLETFHAEKIETLHQEVEQRGRQIRHLRHAMTSHEIRNKELEESTAFQLGLALIRAMTSLDGAFRLPVRLLRLARRGIARRLNPAVAGGATSEMPARLPDDLSSTLLQWISSQARADDAASILYADINLNIVDGSSVWLSTMASILCSRGPCILVSKVPVTQPVVLSNVRNPENLIVLDPSVFAGMVQFSMQDAIKVVREVDALVPGTRRVVVRGLEAADALLADRQFDGRAAVYLTDFYSVLAGERISSEAQVAMVRSCLAHAEAVLVQTPEIEGVLRSIAGEYRSVELPPVVPVDMPPVSLRPSPDDGVVRIGYAGKVNSRWGVIELLDWSERAIAEGLQIELHIVANKISNGPEPGYEHLRGEVLDRIQRLGVRHYTDFNRLASMELMSRMDFVWCYRPARFEELTIELSTKLVEMASLGARCICHPSDINRVTLGEDYPFFISGYDGFMQIVRAPRWCEPPIDLSRRISTKHGFDAVVERVGPRLLPDPECLDGRTTVIAGHDMKFIDAFVSRSKAAGHRILCDRWDWGRSRDETTSAVLAGRADVLFCEWGLANAAWASKHLPEGKRLVVRVHAQEVRERARRFGAEIDAKAVDAFVFVSDTIRERALELWGWPEEKTHVIPNYVLDQEYTLEGRLLNEERVVLGMVGIVPTLKRFDRALDLLAALVERGVDARLELKGHRPETLEFMQAPGRRDELEFYHRQYARIDSDPRLRDRVGFAPWGNDVARWYKGIDVVLSCSESESFHYALADGVLSGCFPVVWPWPGAERVYAGEWVVEDVAQACDRVLGFIGMSLAERDAVARENRAIVVGRYGFDRIANELLGLLDAGQQRGGEPAHVR